MVPYRYGTVPSLSSLLVGASLAAAFVDLAPFLAISKHVTKLMCPNTAARLRYI